MSCLSREPPSPSSSSLPPLSTQPDTLVGLPECSIWLPTLPCIISALVRLRHHIPCSDLVLNTHFYTGKASLSHSLVRPCPEQCISALVRLQSHIPCSDIVLNNAFFILNAFPTLSWFMSGPTETLVAELPAAVQAQQRLSIFRGSYEMSCDMSHDQTRRSHDSEGSVVGDDWTTAGKRMEIAHNPTKFVISSPVCVRLVMMCVLQFAMATSTSQTQSTTPNGDLSPSATSLIPSNHLPCYSPNHVSI